MNLVGNIAVVRRSCNLWETALCLLVGALLCFDLFILLYGISNGINDFYAFRQSQTALTAYWLIKEPHTFAYITPVLGAPWSMPFEYPIYQWLAAFLTKVGVPLVAAGRLVSFAAFIGCLIPLWTIARDLKISRRAFLVVAVVYLACPLYIFWSRTFMIETTALFFSLCWLAGLVRGRNNPGALLWLATLGFGCLAVLAKSTTFASVGPIAGAFYLYDALVWLRRDRTASSVYRLLWRGLLFLIPIMVGGAWVAAAEHFRAQNVFSLHLSPEALRVWVFGTVALRFDLRETILTSLKQAFGYFGLLVPILIALDLIHSRYRTAILFAVAGYLSAFFIFTNLHGHTYYQCSNAIFACIAVGLTIASMIDKGLRKTTAIVLVCVIASQLHYFREYFWSPVVIDNIHSPSVLTAKAAREATKPDESLVFFGDEWSSVVPFYSERKSLGIPYFTQQAIFEKILADPQSFLDGAKLGGVIDCRLPPQWQTYKPEQMAKIDQFMSGRKILFQNEYCRLAAP